MIRAAVTQHVVTRLQQVFSADHLSAVWREAKALLFEERLKALGLDTQSGASKLLQEVQVATKALNTLQQEQQVCQSRPKTTCHRHFVCCLHQYIRLVAAVDHFPTLVGKW